MATISDHKPNDTEMAKEETVIKIERIRVSFVDKLLGNLSKCMPLSNGWPLLCIYTIIIGIASISVVVYLKAIGEWLPFCLYDNWYYLTYYLLLCFFGAILIPTVDFNLWPPTSRFWPWARRMGAFSWFLELEAFAYMLVFYRDIAYEVEFDDEAQMVVWAMATLGFLRLLSVTIAYWTAVNFLHRIQRRNKLSANHFGKTLTDLCDILVIQLIAQSLYYYQLNIYNIGFILSASYLYIMWARF